MDKSNTSAMEVPHDMVCAFSIRQVASRLGVSPSFIRLEITRGALCPTRLGRRVVITARELDRYVAANTHGQAAR